MPVLSSFFVLLFFELAGETLRKAAHVPIPGPVLGMAMLAALYILRRRELDTGIQIA